MLIQIMMESGKFQSKIEETLNELKKNNTELNFEIIYHGALIKDREFVLWEKIGYNFDNKKESQYKANIFTDLDELKSLVYKLNNIDEVKLKIKYENIENKIKELNNEIIKLELEKDDLLNQIKLNRLNKNFDLNNEDNKNNIYNNINILNDDKLNIIFKKEFEEKNYKQISNFHLDVDKKINYILKYCDQNSLEQIINTMIQEKNIMQTHKLLSYYINNYSNDNNFVKDMISNKYNQYSTLLYDLTNSKLDKNMFRELLNEKELKSFESYFEYRNKEKYFEYLEDLEPSFIDR